jgi:hypothetical protein
MNIIPFDSGSKLPAYLKQVDVASLNADLTSHAGGGFPAISIKGKVFAVVRDGEREVLRNPKDPDSAATSLDVVLLKANKGTSKVFYIKGYNPEQSEGQKPDCYSNEGIEPAADAQNKQAKKCATCPHNQWGSRITEKGASKGKACNDTVRMAVAAAGMLNDPMLLRVPPASIRALGEYGQTLAKRGVAYNMVVTKVAFDMDAESPKLTFKPVGFLDDAAYAEVQETVESDIVNNILGASFNAVEAAPAAKDTEVAEEAPAPAPATKPTPVAKPKPVPVEEPAQEPEPEPVAPVAKPKPAAKATPKPAPKPAPVEDDFDLDLDGISFDD